jgi:hypothetical protein
MKSRKTFFNCAVLALTFTLLASCKSSGGDDEDAPPTDEVTGSAPVIFGEPATNVAVGSQYLFLPDASDEDGDVLTFSIDGEPDWAEFDTTSGQLQGTPQSGDVGEYPDIVISVTDGNSVVSLAPFTVTVTTSPQGGGGGGGDGSAAPTVSGKPNQFVVAGSTYAFQPAASDPDGDTLSWSIVNKPAWATFNTTTGRLEGSPTSSHLGQGGPIEVSVTDGDNISALAPFTITVEATGSESYTLSWVPPTQNEDGSELTDLAGYRIYYGMIPGEYTETVAVDSAGLTSFVLDNLAPGQYFLVMTAINSAELESRYTAELAMDPAG